MDPVESVRTEFMREVCRSMEEAGVATAASGSGSGAGAGQNGGGPASLRFMAYLSLVATEVGAEVDQRRHQLTINGSRPQNVLGIWLLFFGGEEGRGKGRASSSMSSYTVQPSIKL